jgi:hypothetical protein
MTHRIYKKYVRNLRKWRNLFGNMNIYVNFCWNLISMLHSWRRFVLLRPVPKWMWKRIFLFVLHIEGQKDVALLIIWSIILTKRHQFWITINFTLVEYLFLLIQLRTFLCWFEDSIVCSPMATSITKKSSWNLNLKCIFVQDLLNTQKDITWWIKSSILYLNKL